MSEYSTIYVTRSTAKEALLKKLINNEFTDIELADLMDTLLKEQLYNCVIVPDDTTINDDGVFTG